MTAYPHLFSPLRIGSVRSATGSCRPPTSSSSPRAGRLAAERRVPGRPGEGGAGLLITGNRVVHPTSTTGFPRVAWATGRTRSTPTDG